MKQAFTVRPAQESDLDAVVALWQDMAQQHAGYDRQRWEFAPDAPEQFRKMLLEALDHKDRMVLVAVGDDGPPMGFLLGRINEQAPILAPTRLGMVQWLGVSPHCRSAGLGRRLVLAAMDEFRRRGVTAMNLLVANENTRAIQFYEKLGMRSLIREMYMRL